MKELVLIVGYVILYSLFFILSKGTDSNMGEITAALIGVISALGINAMVEFAGWKSVKRRIGSQGDKSIAMMAEEISENMGVDKNHVCLTRQHDEIKEILTGDIKGILNKDIAGVLHDINMRDIAEISKKEAREQLLNPQQAELLHTMSKLNAFFDNWQKTIEINFKQCEAIEQLALENSQLKSRINQLENELSLYKSESDKQISHPAAPRI